MVVQSQLHSKAVITFLLHPCAPESAGTSLQAFVWSGCDCKGDHMYDCDTQKDLGVCTEEMMKWSWTFVWVLERGHPGCVCDYQDDLRLLCACRRDVSQSLFDCTDERDQEVHPGNRIERRSKGTIRGKTNRINL